MKGYKSPENQGIQENYFALKNMNPNQSLMKMYIQIL
jgi:hypothetical protein